MEADSWIVWNEVTNWSSPKFSKLRGVRELAMFLEFCRVKVIRIISIQDKIDSRGSYSQTASIAMCFFMFSKLLSEEVCPLPCARLATHVEYIMSVLNLPRVQLQRKASTVRGISSICITTTTLSMTSGRSAASGPIARCSAYSTSMGWSWTVASSADRIFGKRIPKDENE